jgi:uncharacterized protein YjiK
VLGYTELTAQTGAPMMEARQRPFWGSFLLLVGALAPIAEASLPDPPKLFSVREVRTVSTRQYGVARPQGLSYVPGEGAFLVAGRPGRPISILRLRPPEKRLGSQLLPGGDPTTLAYDAHDGVVTVLSGKTLVSRTVRSVSPGVSAAPTSSGDLHLGEATGATFDRNGDLLLLDAARRTIVEVKGGDPALGVRRIPLNRLDAPRLQGLAFNRADGLLYVASGAGDVLFAIDRSGTVQASYSLLSIDFARIRALAFAPSTDSTDDPSTLNLFIADSGDRSSHGRVTEVTLASVATDVPVVAANLVRRVNTSEWSPASPDPSGVTYLPGPDRLQVVDSEVDEVTGAGYHGVNLWQSSRTGSVADTGTTLAFSSEPTGLGHDPATNTLFISSDQGKRRVYVVGAGNDGRFGTADDAVSFINAAALGSTDTEDPEFDPASGHLFFVDGVNAEVYRIDPTDGVFGNQNDVVSHFDVGRYGATDVEALGSDQRRGTLLVGDHASRQIYEVTMAGDLVRIIDASGIPGMIHLSGLTAAPATDGSGALNYWTVDRGVDNDASPSENDGKLFELTLGATSSNTPPVVDSVVIDQGAPRTNDSLTVTVTASDPDGDPLTYLYQWQKNGTDLPGRTSPTLNLSQAGNGDKGDQISVRVTAFDGRAASTPVSSAAVVVVNSDPSFSQNLGDRTGSEGEVVSLSAAATDPDGEGLTYGATGLPPGLSIDAGSGLISGTIAPGAASGGPYAVEVTVADGPEVDATDTFTWTVVTAATNPTVTLLDSFSDSVDLATYTSPNTRTPTPGRLLVAFIGGRRGSSQLPADPTVSGYGLTWTKLTVGSFIGTSSASSRRWTYVYVAKAGTAPAADRFSVAFTGSVQGLGVLVAEVQGADLSGTAAEAFGATASASTGDGVPATSLTVPLGRTPASTSTVLAVFHRDGSGASLTPGAQFTELGEVAHSSPSSDYNLQADTNAPAASADATFPSSAVMGIALEVKAAPG